MKYEPQLATLVKSPPSGDRWVHEIKFDGYRIGCQLEGGRVTLTSRNGKDWTAAFPEIVEAARKLKRNDLLLDGEVAAVLADGRTSFQALQHGGRSEGTLVYFAFDLLQLDDERIATLPLAERKKRLQSVVGAGQRGRIRYSAHVAGSGSQVLQEACRLGLEGIISKRADLPYMPGRNDAWVKTKCTRRQEFVIGGFTDPHGARAGLGALLIGHYASDVGAGVASDVGAAFRRPTAEKPLVFAGRVGTGFTQRGALDLRKTLASLEQPDCPFSQRPAGPLGRTAHWVRPHLVCEVAFTEWTNDGQLRHPSFQGLRPDKKAADVRRE